MEESHCVCTERKLESFLRYIVKGLNICYVVKKWDQTGKLGEENNLKVCSVSQHTVANTVCEQASRKTNNPRRHNKNNSQK